MLKRLKKLKLKEIKCITHPNNAVKWTLEPKLVERIVTSDDLRVV